MGMLDRQRADRIVKAGMKDGRIRDPDLVEILRAFDDQRRCRREHHACVEDTGRRNYDILRGAYQLHHLRQRTPPEDSSLFAEKLFGDAESTRGTAYMV